LLATLLNGKELKEIRDTFAAIDADSSGSISLSELCDAYKKMGQLRRNEELDDIMKRVDFDENGEINYSEFISGTMDRTLLSRDNLWKVFKYLDSLGSEILTYDTLKQSFQRRGDFMQADFDKMMAQIKLVSSQQNNSPGTIGKINFDLFCDLMEPDKLG